MAERAFIFCMDVPKPESIARDKENFIVNFDYSYLDDFASDKKPDEKYVNGFF